ncbi:WhiB family transcriptional regulator [Xylanibacterium ulmi]|uniref:Transcriptional regulator WhiB n=1 Tax=Xylanimonas ulmi TaxID=228973 RepID=A0A4Q7M5W1_9MICO|nr:WhiB family redox-sensing transcriptional regulator [Xylanibacterium ulmi]
MNDQLNDEPVGCALPRGVLGACVEADPRLFFGTSRASITAAVRVCRERCVVQATCLVHALDAGQRLGVWGGYSEEERRLMVSLRRRRDAEVAAARARERALRARASDAPPPPRLPRHLTSGL